MPEVVSKYALFTSSVELVSHRLNIIQFGTETALDEQDLPERLTNKMCIFSCQTCQFIITCPKPPSPPVIISRVFLLLFLSSDRNFEFEQYSILFKVLACNIALIYIVGLLRGRFSRMFSLLGRVGFKV